MFAELGYEVSVVDMFEETLAVGRKRLASSNMSLNFHHGDVRTVRLGKNLDAAAAFFHVVNYQTSNEDDPGRFR